MKQKKTLSNILTSRYLLIIRDEENFAEKGTIRFNYVKIIFLLGSIFLVMMTLSFLLVTTILAKWFDPRSDVLVANQRLIEMENKVDSLISQSQVEEQYVMNIKNILTDNINNEMNTTVEHQMEVNIDSIDLEKISPIDEKLRKEFEDVEYEKFSYIGIQEETLRDIYFFTPLKGLITSSFDVRNDHYGTDIVAKKNEPIKCVAEGTVLIADWTQEAGHVIIVQHKNHLISVYKHNSTLLKKPGDVVKGGDIVAIIGNSGEFTDGHHLHFELWYDGTPVNPENFILF